MKWMCGMGRRELFTFEQEGVAPDLICIGKGLGAGYQPIGAVIATSKVYDAIVSGGGFFQHGHTYLGHAAACAGAGGKKRLNEDESLRARRSARRPALKRNCTPPRTTPELGDNRGRGPFRAP